MAAEKRHSGWWTDEELDDVHENEAGNIDRRNRIIELMEKMKRWKRYTAFRNFTSWVHGRLGLQYITEYLF